MSTQHYNKSQQNGLPAFIGSADFIRRWQQSVHDATSAVVQSGTFTYVFIIIWGLLRASWVATWKFHAVLYENQKTFGTFKLFSQAVLTQTATYRPRSRPHLVHVDSTSIRCGPDLGQHYVPVWVCIATARLRSRNIKGEKIPSSFPVKCLLVPQVLTWPQGS